MRETLINKRSKEAIIFLETNRKERKVNRKANWSYWPQRELRYQEKGENR